MNCLKYPYITEYETSAINLLWLQNSSEDTVSLFEIF